MIFMNIMLWIGSNTVATFDNTTNATPFGVFDDESSFKTDADKLVVYVKRKLGDDVLSVELTKKQIWANFEEAVFEYSSILNQYQAKSQMLDFLGYTTGSTMSGSEGKYPRMNLEYLDIEYSKILEKDKNIIGKGLIISIRFDASGYVF